VEYEQALRGWRELLDGTIRNSFISATKIRQEMVNLPHFIECTLKW
jgi:hypothetical protein